MELAGGVTDWRYLFHAHHGGGWAVIVHANTITGAFTTGAVGSVGSSFHKLSDTQINALLAASGDSFNVRLDCGGLIGKANLKSGWIGNGAITTCAGAQSGFCGPESCGGAPYCGMQVATANASNPITTMLNPAVYGSGYSPCRKHNIGDGVAYYLTR